MFLLGVDRRRQQSADERPGTGPPQSAGLFHRPRARLQDRNPLFGFARAAVEIVDYYQFVAAQANSKLVGSEPAI